MYNADAHEKAKEIQISQTTTTDLSEHIRKEEPELYFFKFIEIEFCIC
jgi:hypothetical protein